MVHMDYKIYSNSLQNVVAPNSGTSPDFTPDTSDLCLKGEGPSDSRPCPGKPLQRGEREGLTKRIHVRMFFDLAFFVRVNQ